MCRKSASLRKCEHLTEEYYKQQMSSYIGWAKYGKCIHLLQKILLYQSLMKYLY